MTSQEVKDKLMAFGWEWILVPILLPFVLTANILLSVFWFFSELLIWIVRFLKWLWRTVILWIWREVILAGAWMLLKLGWHYLIIWPWNFFIDSFRILSAAFSWKYFKIGFQWLSISLMCAFLGRYISLLSGLPLLAYPFGILSFIPFGIGLSRIISSNHAMGDDQEAAARYRRHLVSFVSVLLVIVVAEFVIVYLSSYTPMSYFISALFAGGLFGGSILLILNALLVIFSLIALPSFSRNFEGSGKSLFTAFGNHLKSRWLGYLVALPFMVLPIVLACIIPYFLSAGASSVTGNISDAAFDTRIGMLDKKVVDQKEPDYNQWLDIRQISETTFDSLKQLDRIRIEDQITLTRLKRNRSYMSDFFNLHASDFGAIPLLALHYATTSVSYGNDKLLKTSTYVRDPFKISDQGKAVYDNIRDKIMPFQTKEIQSTDERITNLKSALDRVCDSARPRMNAEPQRVEQAPPVSPGICVQRRIEIRKDIQQAESYKKDMELRSARAYEVTKHLALLQDNYAWKDTLVNIGEWLGFLLVSLWYCLLMGFAFAMLLPVFALMNDHVYAKLNRDEKIHLFDVFKQANIQNRNQPFLGILLSILLVWGISNVSSQGLNLVDRLGKTASTILGLSSNVIEFAPELPVKIADSTTVELQQDTVSIIPELMELPLDSLSLVDSIDSSVDRVYAIDELTENPEFDGEFSYDDQIHIKNFAPQRSYTISVNFIIDANGNVGEINFADSTGYGMEDELRKQIINTSGKWKPGQKDGITVKSRYEAEFKFGE